MTSVDRNGTKRAAVAAFLMAAVLAAASAIVSGSGFVRTASAQSILADRGSSDDGRYQMQAVDGGIARLDTRTGDIVLCKAQGGRMSCADDSRAERSGSVSAPDAPKAAPDRTQETEASLADRVAALEAKVEALQSDDASQDVGKAADAAVDRARKLFKGFAGVIRDFDRELRDGDRGDSSNGAGNGYGSPSDGGSEDGDGPLPGRT